MSKIDEHYREREELGLGDGTEGYVFKEHSYDDEHEERKDLEKSLDGVGLEYLHCSTCAYIYVEGKNVYDISKSNMLCGKNTMDMFLALNEVAVLSEKGWCDARWLAKELSYSIKQWYWDDLAQSKSA